MNIYYQNDKIEYESVAIALGNFDGVHIGHLRIIENAKNSANYAGVLIFENHTREEKVITPFDEKIKILSELGVDFVYVVKFDDKFKSMSLEEFVVFLKELGVTCLSVGYDYRCAKEASADAEALREASIIYGIRTVISPMVTSEGKEVKSSIIRDYIKDGKIKEANRLMVKPFTISGEVVDGFHNGRKMGFPTANIKPNNEALLPCDGAYYCTTFVDGNKYKAVVNIGNNPTLEAKERTVEGHILGLDTDLYGRKISFTFYDRIRGEMKFSSLDELKLQIAKDIEYVESVEI